MIRLTLLRFEPLGVVGLQEGEQEGVAFLGRAIQIAPHPKTQGDIDLIPVAPLFHAIGFRPKEILQPHAGLAFRGQLIEIPFTGLGGALWVGLESLMGPEIITGQLP